MSRPPVAPRPSLRLSPIVLAGRLVLFGMSSTAAAALLLGPDTAHAQTAPDSAPLADTSVRQYNIPAGPLGRSLAQFATQSGLLLSFDPAMTRGLQAPALQGGYTTGAGLQILLAGSGLEIIRRPDSSYTLRQKKNPGKVAELQEVTVVGSISPVEEVYTAPRSSVYISSAEIERYAPISTSDLFKGVPGVQVGDSRNGGALDINIRGIQGQSRIAVTVDGAQQALDVYRGYAGTQQRSYIDPDLLSSITINKGPSLSASAGGNAIGGSVEMRTIGVDDILLPGQSVGVRLMGNLWNNGQKPAYRPDSVDSASDLTAEPHDKHGDLFGSHAQSGSLAFAISGEKIDFLAAFSKREQGNYFAGKHGHDAYRSWDEYGREEESVAKVYQPGEEVLNSSAETRSVLLKTTIRPAPGHTLELGYRNYDGRQGEIMPSDIFRFGTANIYQYPQGRMRIDTATLRYDFSPADNPLINLKANLWATDARSSQLNAVTVPSSEFFVTDRGWVRQNNRRIGGDLSNRSEFGSAIGNFAVDIGGSFQIEELGPQSRVVTTQHDINANRQLRDAHRRQMDLTGKIEYRPIDPLKIWAGLRFSQYHTRDRNVIATGVRETRLVRNIVVSKPGMWGNMWWEADANGEFTDATDPRLHNGIVWEDSNHPFNGIPYDEASQDATVTVYDPREVAIVTGYTYSQPQEDSGHGYAPSVGAEYEFAPNSIAYVSYTQGLRLPSLFESSLGTLQVHPGQALKPERSRSWEIGLSTLQHGVLSQRDMLAAKLAYFDTNIKNYITRYYDPTTWGLMTFTNTDRYKVNGLEFQSQYDTGTFFMDLSGTRYFHAQTCDAAFAGHLRSNANEYMPTENTPDCTPGSFMGSFSNTQNPPKYAINLMLGTRLLDERLTVGGRMVFTAGPTEILDKPWQVGATTPQLLYRPVKVFDAFLSYQFHKQASLNVSLQNITNRYYLDPLAQSYMPAPGRTLNVGLKVQM
ncbi:TonB-dependent receptor [Kerstersia gyiorum]|uniref:TonB-dependent receptor n=1 Tax=Kerstersia gyiorum TaxID=206506 RepID=UPI00242C5499|nr:TonB-dependent receptor [Kerstersia gyiorum]MCH4270882.1 TonB-dependent receptor [Kerstersia gyiorum]MCI1229424.1 TonB-dependent receptor [Kerstersia gyiorum]